MNKILFLVCSTAAFNIYVYSSEIQSSVYAFPHVLHVARYFNCALYWSSSTKLFNQYLVLGGKPAAGM